MCTTCAFLALNALFESRGQSAGPLDPPAGSPAPNMVTLGELSKQLGELQARFDARPPGGKNVAIGSTDGTVSVWDHESSTWSS